MILPTIIIDFAHDFARTCSAQAKTRNHLIRYLRGESVKDFPCPAVFCIHLCITDEMRNFFTGRATRFAGPPSPVAPPLRARARNEGPNRRFGLTGPLGLSMLVILMCGEPPSDILAQKRNG